MPQYPCDEPNRGDVSHREICDQINDLIPAYSIGATNADETALIDAHLMNCPDAVEELAGYQPLVQALHYSVPIIEPPASLEAKLMAAVREPSTATAQRNSTPRNYLRQLPAFQPKTLAAIAALFIVFLFGVNVYLITQVSSLKQAQQQTAMTSQQQEAVMQMFASDKAVRIALKDDSGANGPSANLLCNPDGSLGLLSVQQFPVLTLDKSYQVWLMQDGKYYGIRLFNVESDGSGMVIIEAPNMLRNFDEIRITIEPATGSATPTTPPLVRGNLYND